MTKFSYWKQKKHLERSIRIEEKPYAQPLSEALREDNRRKLSELLAERDARGCPWPKYGETRVARGF